MASKSGAPTGVHDGLDPDELTIQEPQPKGCRQWVYKHRLLVGFMAAVAFIMLVLISVLVPVAMTVGLGQNKQTPRQDAILSFEKGDTAQEFPNVPGPLTLLISYINLNVNVMDRVPTGLKPFVRSLRIESSATQLLTADSERILREVYKHLKSDADVSFLVRDVFLNIPKDLDSDASGQLRRALVEEEAKRLASTDTGRRLAQLSTPSPNDPMFRYQWHLLNNQTYSSSAEGAWRITAGQPDLIIAVTDTGVDYGHPDLQANMWFNRNEIPNDGVDNDQNGFVDDYWGWNFGSNNRDPMDTDGHGTNVAGIVSAVTNNRWGVASVAYNTRIMALRITDASGFLSLGTAMLSFDYAMKNGAHIVVCSWGPGWYSYSQAPPVYPAARWERDLTSAYTNAIHPLEQAGVLIVAAAGNTNMNLDPLKALGYFYAPCLVNTSNLICVGASDRNSPNKASFSNWGNTSVHIHAPGRSICSTTCRKCYYGDDYACYDGTSQATPLTAAALALTSVALGSNYLAQSINARTTLFSTAVPGNYTSITPGRINITAAVISAFDTQSVKPVPEMDQLSVEGLYEEYYSNPKLQWLSTAGLRLLDFSFRPSFFPLTSYKMAGTDVLLRVSTTVALDTAGSWAVRIISDRNFSCTLGGAPLRFTKTLSTSVATFNLAVDGWYAFELLLANPSSRIDVAWRRPASTTFVVLTSFFTPANTTAPAAAADTTPVTGTGFLIKYARSSTPISRSAISFLNTSNTVLPLMAASKDLNYTLLGSWGSFLFPTAPPAATIGTVETTLMIPNGNTTAYAFQVSCSICQLLINRSPVLDIWENTQKMSLCVTFPGGGAYNLLIKFGENVLVSADHILQWSPCTPGQPTTTLTFASLGSAATSQVLWDPAQQLSGYTQGLHCDVWMAGGSSFNASITPNWKALQPSCGTHLQSYCTKTFNLTLNDMLPGLSTKYPAANGTTFNATCWTFWRDLPGNLSAWSAAGNASLTLAGLKVNSSTPAPSWLQGPFHRQVLLEFSFVTSTTTLALVNESGAVTMNVSQMFLPIFPVSGPSGIVGSPGHYSTSWSFSPRDVGNLVPYLVTDRLSTGGVARTTARALDNFNATYVGVMANVQTYAWMRGFLNITTAANYTWTVREVAAQGTLVVLSGVTLKNSPQWNQRMATQTATNVTALLTPGMWPLDMISKTSTAAHMWSVQRLLPAPAAMLTPRDVSQSTANTQT